MRLNYSILPLPPLFSGCQLCLFGSLVLVFFLCRNSWHTSLSLYISISPSSYVCENTLPRSHYFSIHNEAPFGGPILPLSTRNSLSLSGLWFSFFPSYISEFVSRPFRVLFFVDIISPHPATISSNVFTNSRSTRNVPQILTSIIVRVCL